MVTPLIEPEGDRCLTLRYGDMLSEETVLRCLDLARRIEAAGLPGVLDVVAGFTTVSVHYDPFRIGPCAHDRLAESLRGITASPGSTGALAGRFREVPVCYEPVHGFDLGDVAQSCGLSIDEVIAAHMAAPLRVFTLGFAPGLPYMGMNDERLDLPRRDTPRAAVPGGSLAIANRQSVIYPEASPGGWHVIGATPISLFNALEPPYAFLLPGDQVRFRRISMGEFEDMRKRRASS